MSDMEYFPVIRSAHDPSLFRVIITQCGDQYTVHLGDNMVRIFSESGLPEVLGSKLAIVKANLSEASRGREAPVRRKDPVAAGIGLYAVYIRPDEYSSEFDDIGWFVGNDKHFTMYCTVIDEEHLLQLRGEGSV